MWEGKWGWELGKKKREKGKEGGACSFFGGGKGQWEGGVGLVEFGGDGAAVQFLGGGGEGRGAGWKFLG